MHHWGGEHLIPGVGLYIFQRAAVFLFQAQKVQVEYDGGAMGFCFSEQSVIFFHKSGALA